MYKFRTMHTAPTRLISRITAKDDARVFAFGSFLRRWKIDELPQLFNILRGEMSIVGPRPEDPYIVANHYSSDGLETLCVSPGLTSPGTIYYYTHLEKLIDQRDPEGWYIENALPLKLALDLVYVREASVAYDVQLLLRTVWVILSISAGRTSFADPPEIDTDANEVNDARNRSVRRDATSRVPDRQHRQAQRD